MQSALYADRQAGVVGCRRSEPELAIDLTGDADIRPQIEAG
jgi:hypothetical protein